MESNSSKLSVSMGLQDMLIVEVLVLCSFSALSGALCCDCMIGCLYAQYANIASSYIGIAGTPV
jgi:hypothetical protein